MFLYPSRHEGFGLPALEAMACGCPTDTTNVGDIPDYVTPGKTPLVVEPRDVRGMAEHVVWLLEHDDERRRIAEAGVRRLQDFTLDRVLEGFEQALIQVASRQ